MTFQNSFSIPLSRKPRRGTFQLLLLIVLSQLLTSCFTNAFNLREGIESFKMQNYRKAFIRLRPEAERGQRDAQYAIGYMYYYGQGVVENRKKAWFWINSAAGMGQPDAVVAIQILQAGSFEKRKVFDSYKLQNYPVDKGMF